MRLQLGLFLLAAMAVGCSGSKNEESSVKDVQDIVSMQQRADGKFDVVCKDLSRQVATSEEIKSGSVCKAPEGSATAQPQLVIGGKYGFNVPEGMHITSYATSKTVNGSLNLYRIMSASDAYNALPFSCDNSFDRIVSIATTSGDKLDYCQSAIAYDTYKRLSDSLIAREHLEVGSDVSVVSANPLAHERLSVNAFDTEYEFTSARSRFAALCKNSMGSIVKTLEVPVSASFWGATTKSQIWICTASLVGVGSGLPAAETWWIAGTFLTRDGLELPPDACFKETASCPSYRNSSLVEAVYMTKKPFLSTADLAKAAQSKFMSSLYEIAP